MNAGGPRIAMDRVPCIGQLISALKPEVHPCLLAILSRLTEILYD